MRNLFAKSGKRKTLHELVGTLIGQKQKAKSKKEAGEGMKKKNVKSRFTPLNIR